MTGDTLPRELNLLDLALVYPLPHYVIINGNRPREPPTVQTTTIATRPPPPELGWVTFTSGRSYLRLPQWRPGRRGTVEFNFRTIQRHGVMMVTSPSSGRPDFFAIELSDGDLYALFNLGGQTQRFAHLLPLSTVKGKGKGSSSWGNRTSELRDVTCYMGSHSVTFHPTQVNALRLTPAMQAGTRFTYPGGMES